MPRFIITVRYQTLGQLNKYKAAAKLCRWSLNTFMLASADRLANIALQQADWEVVKDLVGEEEAERLKPSDCP